MSYFYNPYQLSNEDLLQNLITMARRTANEPRDSNSSPTAQQIGLDYIKGVLLSRLEGQTPPASVGDKVFPKDKLIQPANSNDYVMRGQPRKLSGPLTVNKVIYVGAGKWEYEFVEKRKGVCYEDCYHYEYGSSRWKVALRFEATDFDKEVSSMSASVTK